MSAPFDQIQMEPAYRKVAAAISGRILDRTLREGDRLPPETELARQFGVNRSTVREALRELESNGLVTRRTGSKLMSVTRPQHFAIAGAVTRGLVMHDVTFREVWEALTLLEPPIAASAATARTSDDLILIDASAERFASDNTATEHAAHGAAEFFRSVGGATHNQVLMLAQEPLLPHNARSAKPCTRAIPRVRAHGWRNTSATSARALKSPESIWSIGSPQSRRDAGRARPAVLAPGAIEFT
jgi:GntR family transcriptional repressor for pyruvate dehydrogenase complex